MAGDWVHEAAEDAPLDFLGLETGWLVPCAYLILLCTYVEHLRNGPLSFVAIIIGGNCDHGIVQVIIRAIHPGVDGYAGHENASLVAVERRYRSFGVIREFERKYVMGGSIHIGQITTR